MSGIKAQRPRTREEAYRLFLRSKRWNDDSVFSGSTRRDLEQMLLDVGWSPTSDHYGPCWRHEHSHGNWTFHRACYWTALYLAGDALRKTVMCWKTPLCAPLPVRGDKR